MVFSPSGRYLALEGEGQLVIWDIVQESVLDAVQLPESGRILHMYFTPDEKRVWLYTKYNPIVWMAPDTREKGAPEKPDDLYQKIQVAAESLKSAKNMLGFDPYSEYVYACQSPWIGNHVQVIDLKTSKRINVVPDHRHGVSSIGLSPDHNILFTHGLDGALKIWKGPDFKELLVTIYSFDDGTVFLTPEGFFHGEGNFRRYVYFVKGLKTYDFNQFYDAFYRPDLVAMKIAGKDIKPFSGGLDIAKALAMPPPKVKIKPLAEPQKSVNRKIRVAVDVKDAGGGVGDIRLYHNGKLIQSRGYYRVARKPVNRETHSNSPYSASSRGTKLVQAESGPGPKGPNLSDVKRVKGDVTETYDIDLIQGDNTISVAAFNQDNTVMSSMESITMKADVPDRPARLFALVIGNSHYRKKSLDLFLPIKDAKDFARTIKQKAAPVFDSVKVALLTDASKTDIYKAISEMIKEMHPEDVFILFTASHGFARDDMYFLITSEFDGALERIGDMSISSLELMEISKVIPPLKQIWILDTCHSGGMETMISGLYDARVSVLAKALGMHLFAAAQPYQAAADEYKGNGLFTHAVLECLKGLADLDKDKKIFVREMSPPLKKLVRKASDEVVASLRDKGINWEGQEAFIKNFGDDFALAATE